MRICNSEADPLTFHGSWERAEHDADGRGSFAAVEKSMSDRFLEHLAPGWTQGKRGIDQSDVGVGLGEVAELEASMREKMF